MNKIRNVWFGILPGIYIKYFSLSLRLKQIYPIQEEKINCLRVIIMITRITQLGIIADRVIIMITRITQLGIIAD